jgi:hypothetical protein
MTRRRSSDADAVIHPSPDPQDLRPMTILALGGLVACALFIARDPVARDGCRQILGDQRAHRRLLDAFQGLGVHATEGEGGN